MPVVFPEAMATDAGTDSAVELEVIATVTPVVGAAALSVTVQLEDAPGPIAAGLHEIELTVRGDGATGTEAEMFPPDAEIVTDAPAVDAPTVPVMPIAAEVAPEASVAFTTATTPLEMIFAFMPERMHVYPAALLAQEIDLPAAVEAVPAVTLMPEMFAAE